MKRLSLSSITLIVALLISGSIQAQESKWAGNFGPTGLFGTVKTIGTWGDSLVIGGEILGLANSNTAAREFVIFDLIDRSWHTTSQGPPLSNAEVRAVAEHPNGSVVIAGDFSFNYGGRSLKNLAVLNKDATWTTLTGDSTDYINAPVNALLWHQGRLFIGGEFTWAGEDTANGFTFWDSDNGFVSPEGLGTGTSENPIIYDFAVSSAHGNDIYLGGDLVYEDDPHFSFGIVRYDIDASQFEALPSCPLGPVYTIHTEDNTDWEDRIAAGGEFTLTAINGSETPAPDCSNIAIFNFIDSTVEVPATGVNGPVHVIKPHYSYEERLLVGGEFDSANGVNTGPLAYWEPSSDSWSRFNPNLLDNTDAIYAIQEPTVDIRYTIGGSFDYIDDSALVNNVVQFNRSSPTSWFPLGDGLIYEGSGNINVGDIVPDGHGGWYVAGGFNLAGGKRVNYVARWFQESWSSLGDGVDNFLTQLAVREDTVYVFGSLLASASGVPVNKIAMWDGSQWHPLGDGIPGDGYIYEMELDSAGNLYICGLSIDTAGTTPVTGVAKWNGTDWEAMGTLGWPGSNSGFIWDMYIDPQSQDVYICGDFVSADGNPCNGVARWNGSAWFPLGDAAIGDGHPYAIERAPNGHIVVAGLIERPELRQMITPGFWEAYAGGVATPGVSDMLTVGCDFFMTGDPLQVVGSEDNFVSVHNVARWDGVEWIDVAGGESFSNDVNAIAAYGSKLAVGGRFRFAAGKLAYGFSIWEGLRDASDSLGLFFFPNVGDTLQVGKITEITWNTTNTTAEQVNLQISYDSGMTWQTYASNIDAQLGKIPWLVPDMPAEYCRMRIADTYAPCAYKESWVFPIIDNPGEDVTWLRRHTGSFYDEPFTVGYHNWNFGNTGGNCWPDSVADNFLYPDWFLDSDLPDTVENFPPWSLFASAFGDDWCYRNGEPGRVRPRAMERWKNILGKWGGSCLGFSTSALVWWEREEFNTNLILPDDNLYSFDLNIFTRNMVNKHWIYQKGDKHVDYNREVNDYTPMQTLAAIRDGLPFADPRTLSFSWRSWKDKTDTSGTVVDSILRAVGHNVVPYAIKTFTDTTGIYYIYVYDSNSPTNDSRFVRVDSVNGTWSFAAYNIPDTTGRFVPRLPISEYIGLATDDRKTKANDGYPETGLLLFASATEDILISDSLGNHVGWVNNEEVNTLADAFPIMSDDPDYQYDFPGSYYLPDGEYQIDLSGFQKPDTRISIESNQMLFTYQRNDAVPAQSDMIHLGKGLSVMNPDTDIKNVTITGISSQGDAERFIRLDGLNFAQNDSTSVEVDSSGMVEIKNYGSSKEYSLLLWYSDPASDSYTQSVSTIQLAANSNHQLQPPWTDLEDSSMYVRIDNDQDGNPDDSVLVAIVTDVEDEHGSGTLPDSYELGQNYPNPFNPTTTIEYTLPVRSQVTISVFNILGQSVITLVNEEKPAGSYTIDWNGTDAAGQPVATGVYFYRLQVNDKAMTKKMLLLK